MPPGFGRRAHLGLVFALLAGGCSADTSTLKTLTKSLSPGVQPVTLSPDPPVDVYSRIAHGALKCWFGPEGSLKKTHVFHAKVDAPNSGTPAEVLISTRDEVTSRGALRAFAISITVEGTGSRVEAQNVRFTQPEAEIMIGDVSRWVGGEDSCSVVGTGGWNAGSPAPPPGAPVATRAPTTPPAKPAAR